MPELSNEQINDMMVELPDKVAEAEVEFKRIRLERERIEALAYFRLKAELAHEKVTEKWLENKVRVDDEVHQAKLDEIVSEGEYNRLYEKLMSIKKVASLRTAY